MLLRKQPNQDCIEKALPNIIVNQMCHENYSHIVDQDELIMI